MERERWGKRGEKDVSVSQQQNKETSGWWIFWEGGKEGGKYCSTSCRRGWSLWATGSHHAVSHIWICPVQIHSVYPTAAEAHRLQELVLLIYSSAPSTLIIPLRGIQTTDLWHSSRCSHSVNNLAPNFTGEVSTLEIKALHFYFISMCVF